MSNINLADLLAQSKPTLVEFESPKSERSAEMEPIMENLHKLFGDRANIVTIDGTENQDLMRQYKVATYPTYILFKDGQEAWRDAGRKKFEELEHMVRNFI